MGRLGPQRGQEERYHRHEDEPEAMVGPVVGFRLKGDAHDGAFLSGQPAVGSGPSLGST